MSASSSGASFRTLVANIGERETRVTGDEARGTTGRSKKRGEAFSFPPSFAGEFLSRERRLGTRQELRRFTSIATVDSLALAGCSRGTFTEVPFEPTGKL